MGAAFGGMLWMKAKCRLDEVKAQFDTPSLGW